ncbi:MAG: hypothetical protein R3E13_07305 [Alphaproteobacteria bacterium]
MSASFDFVECAGKSYLFLWERRRDVLRLSAMAVAVKIVFFVGFVVFDLQQDILRQGLFLLPSYMLEGWVVAHLMIMALHHEVLKSGERKKSFLPAPEELDGAIKASMIVYVLLKMGLSVLGGIMFNGVQGLPEGPPPDPGFDTFVVVLAMLGFVVWAFRFLWLYVPVVMGRGMIEFVRRFRPFMSSFSFLGVWGMCFVPPLLLLMLFSQISGTLAAGSILAAFQAVIDYFMVLSSSIGVAYGVYSVFKGENKPTAIW